MPEKAKGEVTEIKEIPKKDGSGSFYAIKIGGVEMLFFDSKIKDYLHKEVEVEYYLKNDKYFGSFPGAKSGGAPLKRGTSPEELKLKAIDIKVRTKAMLMSYAKDSAMHCLPAGTKEETFGKTMIYFFNEMVEKFKNNMEELK
jgi:hypothetical protein